MELFLHTIRMATRLDPVLMLPPAVFALSYLALGQGDVLGIHGFVWASAVFMIATPLANFPVRVRPMLARGGDRDMLLRMVVIIVALGALVCLYQLWRNDPLVSQRFWTWSRIGFAAILFGFYVFDRDWASNKMSRWSDSRHAGSILLPAEILRHLLFALVNEVLIAGGDLDLYVFGYLLAFYTLNPLVSWLTLLALILADNEQED